MRHRLGKLLMRLGVEGLPNRAALCEAARDLRRALIGDRVPEWLAADLVAECNRASILDKVEPPAVFWSTFVSQVRGVFQKHRADDLPAEARVHGSELYWLTGEAPRVLAGRWRNRVSPRLALIPAAEAVPRPADERLLALPSTLAIDAIAAVRELAERVALTGILLTGLGDAPDAALLVLGPATGVPVQWMATRRDGRDLVDVDPATALVALLGDALVKARPGRHSPFFTIAPRVPTPLDRLYDLFDRLIRRDELRSTLGRTSLVRAERSGWTLERLEEEVRMTYRILAAMTPSERGRPQDVDPARIHAIARAAEVPPSSVSRLIGDYLARIGRGDGP